MTSRGLIIVTFAGVVTYTRSRPEVVHCPHYRLSAVDNLAYILYREHALVYPAQMYHVGFLKLAHASYVRAGICYVNLKEMLP